MKRTVGIIAALIVMAWGTTAQAIDGSVRYGDTGDNVEEVQEALTEGGWPTGADGVFGPITQRTVRAFQRANGLEVDGIVGPATAGALGLPYATAVRLTPPPAGPPAPTFYDGPCAEYAGLLHYFSPGWDVGRMQQIMYRESRCNPGVTSSTGCCRGLLQIHSLHIPYLDVCDVYSRNDLFDPGKNICSAAVLYRRAGGMSPWDMG